MSTGSTENPSLQTARAELAGRCSWAPDNDPVYSAYHDTEWGVIERDPRALWEKLVLDGFQAGLSWRTILYKRDGFRTAFADFNPEVVARFGDAERTALMANAGIIRSNTKIDAAINGARIYLDLQQKGVDFTDLIWSATNGKVLRNAVDGTQPLLAETPESRDLAKLLKSHGFKFCGPVIVYAFMQAVGMVNDHRTTCFRWKPTDDAAAAFNAQP
jgi:DNA-3-methyladenine glycosylase I